MIIITLDITTDSQEIAGTHREYLIANSLQFNINRHFILAVKLLTL